MTPNGQTLYATGGCDDAVYAYSSGKKSATFVQRAKIALGHAPNGCLANSANQKGLGLSVEPNAAGLAVSADGKTLVVANNYNDSISVIDTASATVRYEYDLRPYSTSGAAGGTKGGTFPYSVVLNGTTAYVGCDRDREVVVVNIAATGSFVARIPLDGNPNGMTLDANGQTLYVSEDNQDQVAVINTATNTITHKIDTRGPAYLGLPAGTSGRVADRRHDQWRHAVCRQCRFQLRCSDPAEGLCCLHYHRSDPDRIRSDRYRVQQQRPVYVYR